MQPHAGLKSRCHLGCLQILCPSDLKKIIFQIYIYIYIFGWISTCESFLRSFHLDLLPSARILGGPATLLTSRGPFGATPELGSLAPLRCFVGGRFLDDPSTEQRSRCSAEKVPTNSGKLMGYPDTMEYVWDNDGIFFLMIYWCQWI